MNRTIRNMLNEVFMKFLGYAVYCLLLILLGIKFWNYLK